MVWPRAVYFIDATSFMKRSQHVQRSSIRANNALFLMLCFVVFAYVLIKTIRMPFVLDEGLSFFSFIYPNEFWPFMKAANANNHLLNSLFVWLATQLFGYSNLSIRLPSLLSFWIYAGFLYALGSGLNTSWLKWSFWITFIPLAGILDFFALSRGYGLSFALLMGFVFFALRYVQQTDKRSAYAAIFFSSMACLANLNLVYVHALFLAYLIFRFLKGIKGILGPVITASTLLAYFVFSLLLLKNSGQLFLGEHITAIASLKSILVKSFYPDSGIAFVLLSLQLIAIAAILVSQKKARLTNSPLFYLTLLWLGNVVAIVLAHVLFNVNWPLNRTGMHVYLIFLLVFFFSVNQMQVKWQATLLLILLVPLLIHSFHQYSTSRVIDDEWAAQQVPNQFLEKIESLGYDHAFVIGEPWTKHSFLIQAFVHSHGIFQFQVAPKTHGNADFLLAYPSSNVPLGFVLVAENKLKTLQLWHQKTRPEGIRLLNESGQIESSAKKFQQLSQKISLPTFTRYFTAKVSLVYDYDPGFSSLVFVFQTENKEGKVLDWQKVDLDQLGNIAKKKRKNIDFELELKGKSEEPSLLQLLIFNPKEKRIENLRFNYSIFKHD